MKHTEAKTKWPTFCTRHFHCSLLIYHTSLVLDKLINEELVSWYQIAMSSLEAWDIIVLIIMSWFGNNRYRGAFIFWKFTYCIFVHMIIPVWCRQFFLLFVEDKPQVSCMIHRGCWWPEDARNQCINNHDADLVLPQYSAFSTKGFIMVI